MGEWWCIHSTRGHSPTPRTRRRATDLGGQQDGPESGTLSRNFYGPVRPPNNQQRNGPHVVAFGHPPLFAGSEPTPPARCGSLYVYSPNNNCPISGVKMDNPDQVNRPSHYRRGSIETIQAIEGLGLGYFEGNVLKYLSRYQSKGKPLEDLRKAQWYLASLIDREERNQA